MNTPIPPLDQNELEPSAQDLVDVVDRTTLIENLLNQVIMDYCSPRKDAWEFMWSAVLDTSVISLGSKVKLVRAVANELEHNLKKEALYKVIEYRNAFAHHATNAHPVLVVGQTPEENNGYQQLWVFKSSGKIQRLNRQKAFDDFSQAYPIARDSLVSLRNLVRSAQHRAG